MNSGGLGFSPMRGRWKGAVCSLGEHDGPAPILEDLSFQPAEFSAGYKDNLEKAEAEFSATVLMTPEFSGVLLVTFHVDG